MAREWDTFNGGIDALGKRHEIEILVTYKSVGQIQQEMYETKDFEAMEAAQVEEIMVLGCLAVPKNMVLRPTEELFKGLV